jgi:hypothetical protein
MIVATVIIPLVVMLLWLLSIRPYCRCNGKGFTCGPAVGVTFWVDWQEAGEIAKVKRDAGMVRVCRLVFWLQLLGFGLMVFAIFGH